MQFHWKSVQVCRLSGTFFGTKTQKIASRKALSSKIVANQYFHSERTSEISSIILTTTIQAQFNTMTINKVTVLLLAAALVAANSAVIRGASTQLQTQDEELDRRRRQLIRESTCTLFRKCITHLPTEEHPQGYHEDKWVCQLSEEEAGAMGVEFVDVVESDAVAATISNATSGQSTLTVSEAYVDTDSPRMYIPQNAHVSVGDARIEPRTEKRRRHLSGPDKEGTLKALVVRVVDKNGVAPTKGLGHLADKVFTDDVSLKSQTEACSYGKLKIEPFVGTTPSNRRITNGATSIQMDYDMTSLEPGMDQAALRAAREELGNLNDPRFDLVMFCFPPTTKFLAFAYPNSKYSFYNDEWCTFNAAQMHEVGHNLGLGHSGENGQGNYGDVTGMMGSAPSVDDVTRCYNAQKSYQLGWYDDKVDTINPLDGIRKREFILNGVSDYKRNNNALVVLRLEQVSQVPDYYVGFNRARSMNAGTWEDMDMVTITRKDLGDPHEYGQSTKFASLRPGERYVIEDFNDNEDGRDVQIAFVGLESGNAKILVTEGKQLTQPTTRCKRFTVELTTDGVPSDNAWYITNDDGSEAVAALSPVYSKGNKKYTQQVCLPMEADPTTYTFTLFDQGQDGLCCSRGQGSYKIYNDKNQLVAASGGSQEFGTKRHTLSVPRDPTPRTPTASPTVSPTAKPAPCEPHTIRVQTDDFPEDTSWQLFLVNAAGQEILPPVAAKSDFPNRNKLYTTQVCLPEGASYKFKFFDSHKDGICCSHGDGYYKIVDKCGEVVAQSGYLVDENFALKTHVFSVDNTCASQTPVPTTSKPDECKDEKKGRWSIKRRGPKRSCKSHARKKKCNSKTIYNRKRVWELCPKSCGRC